MSIQLLSIELFQSYFIFVCPGYYYIITWWGVIGISVAHYNMNIIMFKSKQQYQ